MSTTLSLVIMVRNTVFEDVMRLQMIQDYLESLGCSVSDNADIRNSDTVIWEPSEEVLTGPIMFRLAFDSFLEFKALRQVLESIRTFFTKHNIPCYGMSASVLWEIPDENGNIQKAFGTICMSGNLLGNQQEIPKINVN